MRFTILIIISVFIYTSIYANEKIEFQPENYNYTIREIEYYNESFYLVGQQHTGNESSWKSFYIKSQKNNLVDFKIFQYSGRSLLKYIEFDENDNKYILNMFLLGSKDDLSLIKMDKENNIIKKFDFGNINDDFEMQMMEYHNGFLYLCGTADDAAIIIKLDSNLNLIWSKKYYYSVTYYLESFYFEEDRLIMVAWDRKFFTNYNSSLIQAINLDGDVIKYNINHYNIDNYQVRNANDMVKVGDNYLYYLRRYANTNNIEPYLVRINHNFEITNIYDIEYNNFETEITMTEDEENFYLVTSNSDKSYIHKYNKISFEYVNSFFINNMNYYKLNSIKLKDKELLISGYLENNKFFAIKTNINDNCYLNDTILDVKLTNKYSTELVKDSYEIRNYNGILNYNFQLINNDEIEIDFSTCSTPCGDGSEFDSKVSSLDKFELNGAKLTEIDSYIMTDEKDYFSHGALSHIVPVYVSAGFNSEFAFKIDKGYNDFIDGSLPGADGFSLVFHTDNQHLNFKSDQYGGGMGFHNRKNAVALEIDLYNNDEYNDPDGNHISFQVPKDGILEAIHNDENTLGISSNIPIMNSDGKETYYCKLEYKDNNLKVWIDITQDYSNPAIEINNFKFSDYLNLIEHSKVYVTLAAVTGTSYQKQEVLFWDWCSYYDPISSVEDNLKETNIIIYPNPSSDMIYIDGINSQKNIELFDLTGRKIISQNYKNGINISDLNRGIYILNIQNQNYKIIKE